MSRKSWTFPKNEFCWKFRKFGILEEWKHSTAIERKIELIFWKSIAVSCSKRASKWPQNNQGVKSISWIRPLKLSELTFFSESCEGLNCLRGLNIVVILFWFFGTVQLFSLSYAVFDVFIERKPFFEISVCPFRFCHSESPEIFPEATLSNFMKGFELWVLSRNDGIDLSCGNSMCNSKHGQHDHPSAIARSMSALLKIG